MIFIVGDIHGEVSKLSKLVQVIENTDFSPSYVFLGDYIDKGEDSFETLKFLVELNDSKDCTFLVGNHEYIWLNHNNDDEKSRNYLLSYGGKETMRSLNVKSIEAAKDKLLSNFNFFLTNCSHIGKVRSV